MEEGKVEAAGYDKYACFCKEQADDKLYSMETKAEKMELLSSTIKALKGDLVNLNKDIRKENKEIDDLTTQCTDEQNLRDTQHAEYVLLRDDLALAISEAHEGIELLKSKKMPDQGFIQEKISNTMLTLAKA